MTDTLEARSPFHGLLQPVGSGRGIVVTDRSGGPLASVQARRGQVSALESGLRGESRSLRVAPAMWWVFAEGAELNHLRDIASVTDQSDAYGVLRLTGAKVRETLGKLVFVDLHPDAFGPRDVASTVAAHVGVTLWRMPDGAEGPVFEFAANSSYAASLWHAISASSVEFGLQT